MAIYRLNMYLCVYSSSVNKKESIFVTYISLLLKVPMATHEKAHDFNRILTNSSRSFLFCSSAEFFSSVNFAIIADNWDEKQVYIQLRKTTQEMSNISNLHQTNN